MDIKIWKEIIGAITPGGDPAYMCPVCFHEHIYGVEHPERIHECPVCGTKLIYPDEGEEIKFDFSSSGH